VTHKLVQNCNEMVARYFGGGTTCLISCSTVKVGERMNPMLLPIHLWYIHGLLKSNNVDRLLGFTYWKEKRRAAYSVLVCSKEIYADRLF
jgi:hypothetical protein